MELSNEILEGLLIAGDTVHVSDKFFHILLQRTLDSIINEDRRHSLGADKPLSGIDAGVLKQVHASLTTLFLEAARHDRDSASISHILEDSKFTPDRITIFNKIYSEYKPQLQVLLSRVGGGLPHIVDVDWRLDYYIKNNHLEKVNKPTFLISLKTEKNDSSKTEDVQFACTQEQLQDLVGKLKEACKSLERASQM